MALICSSVNRERFVVWSSLQGASVRTHCVSQKLKMAAMQMAEKKV